MLNLDVDRFTVCSTDHQIDTQNIFVSSESVVMTDRNQGHARDLDDSYL